MQGVATMVLESPFYGARRPAEQQGAKLLHVSDLLTLGRSTIEESLFLLSWAQKQGLTQLGGCVWLRAVTAILGTELGARWLDVQEPVNAAPATEAGTHPARWVSAAPGEPVTAALRS